MKTGKSTRTIQSKRAQAIALGVLLGSATIVGAHGDGEHISGVVKEADPSRIVVAPGNGAPVEVLVTEQTRFRAGDKPARIEGVHPNTRVYIDVERKDGRRVAKLVRLAPASAPSVP